VGSEEAAAADAAGADAAAGSAEQDEQTAGSTAAGDASGHGTAPPVTFELEEIAAASRPRWKLHLYQGGRPISTIRAREATAKRGELRVQLTVTHPMDDQPDEPIVYEDRVNLASHGSRELLIKRLAAKHIPLPDDALLALLQACRNAADPGADAPPPPVDPYYHDAPRLDHVGLKEEIDRWYVIVDPDYLPVVGGTFCAHKLEDGPQVWPFIIGPPGSGKTVMLVPSFGYPTVVPLSSFTGHTLISGYERHDGTNASLAPELDGKIVVCKDFTTLLTNEQERALALAHLREAADGKIDGRWGTGQQVHFRGRFNFITAVTEVVDRYQQEVAACGERVVHFRLRFPATHDERVLEMVQKHANRGAEMETALRTAFHGFLDGRCYDVIPTADDPVVIGCLKAAATIAARARSVVTRGGKSRTIHMIPSLEKPTRLFSTLLGLGQGIAVYYDSPAVTTRELGHVVRVAFDSIPPLRSRVLAVLAQLKSDECLSTKGVSRAVRVRAHRTAIHRTLEDLWALGMVGRQQQRGSGRGRPADHWYLETTWCQHLTTLAKGIDLQVNLKEEGGSQGWAIGGTKSSATRKPKGEKAKEAKDEMHHREAQASRYQERDADEARAAARSDGSLRGHARRVAAKGTAPGAERPLWTRRPPPELTDQEAERWDNARRHVDPEREEYAADPLERQQWLAHLERLAEVATRRRGAP
jgi:hypothetical protein